MMGSSAVLVFFILFVGLIASLSARPGGNAHSLSRLGRQMSDADTLALEEHVRQNPNDLDSRTKLLGYYFSKRWNDDDASDNQVRHIVWLIENAPESEVLGLSYASLYGMPENDRYERAKQAWVKVIEASPENLTILKNAAAFFLLQDCKMSEDLLLRGQSLDAKDPKWCGSLGRLYSLELMSLPAGAERRATADKAFQYYKLAYDLYDAKRRDSLLVDLAKSAFAAGLIDEARAYATTMLDDNSSDWDRGNHIHHGNLVLGQIALLHGDVAEAKSRLLLAGKTHGSPQLNSFGPNMLLANELLERGESAVVLEYFDLCSKFWTWQHRGLEQWAEDVKSNRVPQFRGNLG